MKFPFDIVMQMDQEFTHTVKLKIQGQDWAPGIWAGTEEAQIQLRGYIKSVDFDSKEVEIAVSGFKFLTYEERD